MNRTILIAASCAGWLVATSVPAAEGERGFTTGFDYSSGDYGGPGTTEILTIPFTGSYEKGRWLYKLTLPLIEVTGPGDVVPGVGRKGRGRGNSGSATTTHAGIGDVVGAVTYNLVAGGEGRPWIDLTGKVKLGTADEDKGLGTGENDLSVQTDAYQAFGDITGFVTLGYSILGDSAALPLNNVAYVNLGASRKFRERITGGLMLNLRQAASDFGDDQRDLTAFVNVRLDDPWKLQAYVLRGFSDGSPDFAVGALATRAF